MAVIRLPLIVMSCEVAAVDADSLQMHEISASDLACGSGIISSDAEADGQTPDAGTCQWRKSRNIVCS